MATGDRGPFLGQPEPGVGVVPKRAPEDEGEDDVVVTVLVSNRLLLLTGAVLAVVVVLSLWLLIGQPILIASVQHSYIAIAICYDWRCVGITCTYGICRSTMQAIYTLSREPSHMVAICVPRATNQ